MASPSEDMSLQLLRCRLWTISTISSRVKLASSYVDSNGCDRSGAGIFCMPLLPFLFCFYFACDGAKNGTIANEDVSLKLRDSFDTVFGPSFATCG